MGTEDSHVDRLTPVDSAPRKSARRIRDDIEAEIALRRLADERHPETRDGLRQRDA